MCVCIYIYIPRRRVFSALTLCDTFRSVTDDFVEHTQSESKKNATMRYIYTHTHTHIIYPQIAQTI